MDPVKIVVFLAFFGLLLVIGRMLAASSEVHGAQLPHPDPLPGNAVAADYDVREEGRQPAVTGAEIDFPIPLPPIQRTADGIYNRPIVRNYYFGKTDLVRGPADPASFCDEFYLELQDPETEHIWTYDYTVTTPTGLQQVMNSEKFDSLYLAGNVVVVARWDLRMILHTVMDEVMKSYGHTEDRRDRASSPSSP